MIIQIFYNYLNKNENFKDNNYNITLIDILFNLISFYACYLSWTCHSNKNQNIILRLIYVIIAYIFGLLYIMFNYLFFSDCRNNEIIRTS
jgi:hypothetical protein